ncbi:hypothetical protein, partial [Calothrix rhizosoleniae]|uniref:hypothetical protein n=1 Tax=Calothrix rhizosoleniae TaxID=888997 RepID=UPI001F24EE97
MVSIGYDLAIPANYKISGKRSYAVRLIAIKLNFRKPLPYKYFENIEKFSSTCGMWVIQFILLFEAGGQEKMCLIYLQSAVLLIT